MCHTSCRCVDWNWVQTVIQATRRGHTSCRCVDWNRKFRIKKEETLSHTSCRCVDWNINVCSRFPFPKGHTSCRCVDWNMVEARESKGNWVTPHVGVWIETWKESEKKRVNRCHTSCRCVDWNREKVNNKRDWFSHTSCRCVDWNKLQHFLFFGGIVTPHVGVWIETIGFCNQMNLF